MQAWECQKKEYGQKWGGKKKNMLMSTRALQQNVFSNNTEAADFILGYESK